jgi:hypothetical protein
MEKLGVMGGLIGHSERYNHGNRSWAVSDSLISRTSEDRAWRGTIMWVSSLTL